jgi:hypothetical protein
LDLGPLGDSDPLARKRRLAAPPVLAENYPPLAHTGREKKNDPCRSSTGNSPRNPPGDTPLLYFKTLLIK